MIYPIGIQCFADLRERGFVYVDKTSLVYNLATTGKYYFLSRPRRFGKSLLISTMEAYFSGRKELFKGLALEKLEQEWTEYPILHLDLNTGKYQTEENLNSVLNNTLTGWEEKYESSVSENTFELRFKGIIRRAFEKTGKKVVILIDEYDKPLLQAIGNDDLQTKYRSTLKTLYSVLKTQDGYIKFAFLTGVTKFGKVSIFSDLNNLEDISMVKEYADICGISEDEIQSYFAESVEEIAVSNGLTYEETCLKLKEWYDGYHFCQNSIGVYNPFSLLNTFKKKVFSDYWFETGTPTFLVELLKRTDYNLNRLQNEEVLADTLNSIDTMSENPIPVIYQSGYLTIKGYNEEFEGYRLGFPNREVEKGFMNFLLPRFTPVKENDKVAFVSQFVQAVRGGRPEDFMNSLQTLFEDNDYRIAGKMEIYFQNVMYVIFKIMGLYVEVERATARGRMDIIIKTDDYVYVMELKLDGSAEEALQQIEDKGYAKPFAMDSRKLYKIGVNFSSKTRGIEKYLIQ